MYRFFIKRPIVAMVIAIIMIIVGLVSLFGLPVTQYPKIIPPEILVQANYIGADAIAIEESVATPIEERMSGVDYMNYMYSINPNNGLMRLVVNFDVKTDPNIDQMLTQLRESQAESQLPPDVRSYGVTVQKSFSSPLMLLALYSPKGTYDATFLANYAYINLVDELTRVAGVASVTVFGAGQYAMRCWVRPDLLAQRNITVSEVVTAIQRQNTVNPAGQVGGEPAAAGPAIHLRDPRAGQAHAHPRISALSCCVQIRMGRSYGSAMSPASSSARRTTISGAASTANLRQSLRSSSCPGPMRSMRPKASSRPCRG